jgi:hypothetical protein
MRKKPKNLIHVVFDNGIFESSGGTKTAIADGVDFAAVAKGIGINRAFNIQECLDIGGGLESSRGSVIDQRCPREKVNKVTVLAWLISRLRTG